MRLTALAFAAVLVGCASANETYTPEGRAGHVVNCSGAGLNWGMCQTKAGEICGAKGYNILNRSSDQGQVAGGGAGGLFSFPDTSRTMLIECKR